MAENEIKKEKNNCSQIVESLLNGMDAVLATKTVVGEPTKIGDVTIVPLVDVTFGVGAGASLSKNDQGKSGSGGGGGMGGKMTPSAVLVIKDGHARLVNIKNQDAVTKILDMVPDFIEKISPKKKGPSDDEIVDAAFGDKKEDQQ